MAAVCLGIVSPFPDPHLSAQVVHYVGEEKTIQLRIKLPICLIEKAQRNQVELSFTRHVNNFQLFHINSKNILNSLFYMF